MLSDEGFNRLDYELYVENDIVTLSILVPLKILLKNLCYFINYFIDYFYPGSYLKVGGETSENS